MGKKGKWFGAVKKVFSPVSKEKKEEVICFLGLGNSLFHGGFWFDFRFWLL